MTDPKAIEKVRAADLETQNGSTAKAILLCDEVLQLNPHCAEAHFVMSVAQTARQDLSRAVSHLEKLIVLRPDLPEVHFNLGTLLARQGHYERAESALRTALTLRPAFLDAAVNLARLWTKIGRYAEAVHMLQKAVRFQPDNPELPLELSQTLAQAGRFSEARDATSLAVQLNPDSVEYRIRYAVALEAAGDVPAAIKELKHVLRHNPKNDEAAFLLSAITKDHESSRAPVKYVSRLFDEYAPGFERHLREKLDYRGPEQLFELVTHSDPERAWNILDLGCGTGLCGQVFRHVASSITGVDLSSEMIRLSRDSGFYETLEQGDLLEFLTVTQHRFDLILAADVLSYFGDLSEVIRLCANRLCNSGVLAFTVEALEFAAEPCEPLSDFALLNTRRFAHSRTYLERVTKQFGLTAISIVEKPLRRNPIEPIPAWIGAFRKTEASTEIRTSPER